MFAIHKYIPIAGAVVMAVVVDTTVVVSGVVAFTVDWVTLFVVEDCPTVVMLAVDSTTPVVLSVDWKVVVALGVASDIMVVLSVDMAMVVLLTASTVVMVEVSAVCGDMVMPGLDISVVVSVGDMTVDVEPLAVLTTSTVVLPESSVVSLVADRQIVNR